MMDVVDFATMRLLRIFHRDEDLMVGVEARIFGGLLLLTWLVSGWFCMVHVTSATFDKNDGLGQSVNKSFNWCTHDVSIKI